MTIAQYMKLNIGDTVARTNGPNKGIPLTWGSNKIKEFKENKKAEKAISKTQEQ